MLLSLAIGSIIINEIAWMGTESSGNDEWIELYNQSSDDINLENWVLKSGDEGLKIALKGQIKANSFYLLERSDDNSLPDIKADLIYKGSLSNKGELIMLQNEDGNIADQIDRLEGWIQGDNESKATMERMSAKDWQTSKETGGTPGKTNSKIEVIKEKDPIGEIPKDTTYPEKIFFVEVLPSPEGDDAEGEYIKMKNENDFEVDLSGWKIEDLTGTQKIYTVDEKVKPLNYLTLFRSKTGITLNNSGDGLRLIDPNGKTVDTVNFEKSRTGHSYTKGPVGWEWLAPINKDAEVKNSKTPPKEPTQEAQASLTNSQIINIASSNPKTPTLAIAIFIASFLAGFFLYLKKKIS